MKEYGKDVSEKLAAAIDYIEDHIHDKLTLAQISTAVRFSPYHLHRTCKTMTRQKLMDYVRGRKLTHSLNALLDTNWKLLDIAYQYGFAYEQSYIRAFRRAFGTTPARFRAERPQVAITEKMHLPSLRKVGDGEIVASPRIVLQPEFQLIGTYHQLCYDDAEFYRQIDRCGNDFFYHWREKVPHAKAPHMYIGVIRHKQNEPHRRDYVTALEVDTVEKIPQGMVLCRIPGSQYAVFTYIGLHHPQDTTPQHVRSIYEYIFQSWLPRSDHTFTGGYELEYIDSRIARDDYCEIEICIPIDGNLRFPVRIFSGAAGDSLDRVCQRNK